MRDKLKKYFKTGCKPTEAQFAELLDNIIFKDENGDVIPANRVEGLENLIALIVARYAREDYSGDIKLGSQVEASWLNSSHTLLSLTVDGRYFELNLAQGGGGGSLVSGSWNEDETEFTLVIDGTSYVLPFSGGGSTVEVINDATTNTTIIKVDGVSKVDDLARKGYVDSAVNGKADTIALAAYQKLPDIVQSEDIEVIDGYTTILVKEQTKTTFYEVGEVTNMTIYVADNIAQEVIVSFSIALDSEGSYDIDLEGDYDIVGELPEWETDVRYVVSILDGLVVFGTATHVSSTSNEEE